MRMVRDERGADGRPRGGYPAGGAVASGGVSPGGARFLGSTALLDGAALSRRAFLTAGAAAAATVLVQVVGGSTHAEALPAAAHPACERVTPLSAELHSRDLSPTVPAAQVGELLQLPEFPSGCEAASLAIALRAYGLGTTIGELVDTCFSYDDTWSDTASYLGDPRGSGSAFPPAVVRAARRFLAARGLTLGVRELSGTVSDGMARAHGADAAGGAGPVSATAPVAQTVLRLPR